eukprot:PhM_4_TR3340/c0_g1_i1/m.31294
MSNSSSPDMTPTRSKTNKKSTVVLATSSPSPSSSSSWIDDVFHSMSHQLDVHFEQCQYTLKHIKQLDNSSSTNNNNTFFDLWLLQAWQLREQHETHSLRLHDAITSGMVKALLP